MFGRKKLNRHPLRCPCCGASLADGTDEASIRARAVRSWFLRTMGVIIIAGILLVVAFVFRFTGPIKLHDLLVGAALGLAFGEIVYLRDHWKARHVD